MGSEVPTTASQRYRPPWFWLPVLGLAALLITFAIVTNARSRVAQNERQFRSSQQVRLHEIETQIDDYFGKAIQLVATGAEILGPVRDDVPRAEELVGGLFRSRSTQQIYGVGVFYGPYAFSAALPYFAVYDYVDGGKMRQSLHDPSWTPYTSLRWYRRAAETPGVTRFDGPFVERGISYISTVQAFTKNGKVAGVVAVDTLTPWFVQRNIAPFLATGDIGWIESSRRGKALLQTAPFRNGADVIDEALPLRYTGAYIHLSSDASAMHAANARVITGSAIVALAVWFFSVVFAAALFQFWRSRRQADDLERDRNRLESEISIGKRVETELRKAAYTDGLTGLSNRQAFMESASAAIGQAKAGVRHAVFFIDLDRFNMVNETLGHPFGDEYLKSIASRLYDELPRGSVSRLGGDEFLVIAPVDDTEMGAFAQRILEVLHEPILLGGRLLYTSASIGVVAVDTQYERPEELLRDADIAMYEAKSRGRGCYAIFDTAMRTRVAAESDLENDLRRAIERHEFVPYYQPIFDIANRKVVGFEALVRWRRPGSGVVSASEFIGYAERRGLIDAIDTSMLEDVCRDGRALFETFPDSAVAVNLSAAHLTVPELAGTIDSVLRAYSLRPGQLKLEITETAIMRNPDQARATLRAIQGNGVTIVLDDFGAGHSSLAYLHRLPISGVKIDRSFVAPLPGDAHALAIVRSIVALAKTLDLYTVAEGVETADQLEAVAQLGVDQAQGFFFSPPVPLGSVVLGIARTTTT